MNKNRRNFIKLMLVGTGGLVLGKLLGSFGLFGRSEDASFLTQKDFGAFKVSEDQKELIISDEAGKKILIIDKK